MRSNPLLMFAAAVAVVALALWLGRARLSSPPAAPDSPAPAAVAASVTPAPSLAVPADEDLADLAEIVEAGGTVDPAAFRAKLETTLALYRAQTRYPAWSRPVDGSQPHLLDWRAPATIGQPFAADADGREVEAHATLDRTFAGVDEVLTARVDVFRTDGGARQAVTPDKLAARVEVYAGDTTGWQIAGEPAFVPDGAGWTARFTPSQLERLAAAPGLARLVVHAELGQFTKDLPLTFRYTARPALIVIGKTADRVARGSLDVQLEVDVQHAAPTLVQAALYDATGTVPIATYSDWFRPTARGRQAVTLTFFGKVIRDKGLAGPYRVKQLHGHVRVPDADPLEQWWGHPDDPELHTAAYSAAAFSDAEFSSPETRDAIARYEALIHEGASTP